MTLRESDTALLARGPSRQRTPRAWRALLRMIGGRIRVGRLVFVTPEGERLTFPGVEPGPTGVLEIHHWRMLWRLAVGGDVAFGECYMAGDWSSPDLASLIELAAYNQDTLGATANGVKLVRLVNRLWHLCRPNTRRGSRRNIAQHYDLGNDFYARWLDPSMFYSSALYADGADSLEVAQACKLRRIIELMGLAGGERVLEIGCGWGALAEALAAQHGCHVTGLTLSREQLAFARQRLDGAGLAASADLRLQDYRDVEGTYDRIASIEMIEAVGEAHWPAYFATLRDRLAAGGSAVLQIITISDALFPKYRSGADFIQRYIFPGGMLPSPAVLRDQIARAGLTLASAETFGRSYARTLADWRERFVRAWPDLAAEGFNLRFKRMWEFYLAYCEGGFRAGSIDVGLYRLVKPA